MKIIFGLRAIEGAGVPRPMPVGFPRGCI
jgi:hypothetical protein